MERARWRELLTATMPMSSRAATSVRRRVEHLTQDEHRALAWRQKLDDGEECQLDGLAPDERGSGLRIQRFRLVE